jgi:hypothetical protein
VQHALQHLHPLADPPTRRAAADVVGSAPSLTDAHAALLSDCVADERDDGVWAACLRALTRAARVAPALAESLIVHLGCVSWEVRTAAAAALTQLRLNDETLAGALLERMVSDTDSEVVLHAQRGVVALTRAPSASAEARGDERVVSTLIVNLGDERAAVRRGAVEALAECGLGADALVGALSQRLTTSDPRVLKHLARAFSALGVRAEDDRAITALIVILGHADADVRSEARDVLAAMGLVDEKMTRRLVAMLSDERPALWACALRPLHAAFRFGGRRSMPCVRPASCVCKCRARLPQPIPSPEQPLSPCAISADGGPLVSGCVGVVCRRRPPLPRRYASRALSAIGCGAHDVLPALFTALAAASTPAAIDEALAARAALCPDVGEAVAYAERIVCDPSTPLDERLRVVRAFAKLGVTSAAIGQVLVSPQRRRVRRRRA